jgi:hypothetical protein
MWLVVALKNSTFIKFKQLWNGDVNDIQTNESCNLDFPSIYYDYARMRQK